MSVDQFLAILARIKRQSNPYTRITLEAFSPDDRRVVRIIQNSP